MPVMPVRLLLLAPLLLAQFQAAAQKRTKLDCPRPVRQRTYHAAPKAYLEIGAGLSRPTVYYNRAGSPGEHFKLSSLITPYLTAIGYIALNEQLEAYIGAGITQSWQGLHFTYQDGSGSTSIKSHAGSLVVSLPVGIRYRAGKALRLSAGPYLTYSTHSGQETSSGSSGGGSTSDSYYTYKSPDDRRIIGGLRLAADIRITKRLSAVISCAADAGRSASGYATADLSNRGGSTYEAAVEPNLLHAGVGLSYKFWYKEE